MSENGNSSLKLRAEIAYAKFKDLVSTPKIEPAKPAPPEPKPEEVLASILATWVEQAPKEFWRELDKWVHAAHITARANIKDHSDTTYGLGFEAATEQIRDKFKTWRTTGSADSQGD